MRFSISIEFFCGFAVADKFFDGLEVSNRPSYPIRTVEFHTGSCFANSKSLFLELQIFIFVLFRVLNYSRPRLVISSEIVCGSFYTDFHSQNYQFRCLTIIKESLFDLGCLIPALNEILK